MIRKFRFGKPFDTEAVVEHIEAENGIEKFDNRYGEISITDAGDSAFCYRYTMSDNDAVYGLGEANRGINKRGYIYVSNCSDDPIHTEDKLSLYGAHNFIIVDGNDKFALFFDYPSEMTFDIGFNKQDLLFVGCNKYDLDLYLITAESILDIVKEFRTIIGQSYLAPKFAFGYGQSRWGYKNAEDFREVVSKHRANNIPLDMVYMDIDYMDSYKDFTIDSKRIPDFTAFVNEMKNEKIHLIPIIDAGVKVQPGYDVYEEGKANDYFCKREDGTDFEAAVWPGLTCLPDVLNPEARAWFGEKYSSLIDAGIDGFWNDMNEPAIFYTPEGVEDFKQFYDESIKDLKEIPSFELVGRTVGLANNKNDYDSFYHSINGERVCHKDVHNLYGYNMTRAASEAFGKIAPDKDILLFSRSSYIGMHRYGGIWTGDNNSWWSHILLNLKMLPSLNMCGFLYIGADLGGFGCNTSRDLLLRWLALGVFTPLMRNHSADGTRRQEVYQFEHIEDFRAVINVRYRLIPYLYECYKNAVINNDMMFKPLAFVYTEDRIARTVEDQLLLSDELMIAPVYTQNAIGRYVYLSEEMMFIKFMPDGSINKQILDAGHHFIEVALNEVPLFIRKNQKISIVKPARCVDEIDISTAEFIGYC